MSWQQRRAFNATSPDPEGLARLARDVAGSDARVTALRRLRGGVYASTHAVRVEPGGWLVLKRTWSSDPRSLTGEWHRLAAVESAHVPTPTPIALDVTGGWFGRPALVMSRLPGTSTLERHADAWIDGMAEALAEIHEVAVSVDVSATIGRDHAGATWAPASPDVLRRTPLVESLIEVAGTLQADLRCDGAGGVLLHHDLHQGNVLTRRGRLSGVIDWNEACIGPPECDVAYASVDLAMVIGRRAADRFARPIDGSRGATSSTCVDGRRSGP